MNISWIVYCDWIIDYFWLFKNLSRKLCWFFFIRNRVFRCIYFFVLFMFKNYRSNKFYCFFMLNSIFFDIFIFIY